MKANELRSGMVVVIDDTRYQVRALDEYDERGSQLTHDGQPAVLLDCCSRPGDRRDEGRMQFYLRPDEPVVIG